MNSPGSSVPTRQPANPAAAPLAAARRVHLAGPSAPRDPRTLAARADLADATLAGEIVAPRYARAEERSCRVPVTMIHAAPGGVAVSSLLHGEAFGVLDVVGGWAWGQARHDGYVGYARAAALGAPIAADWRVSAPAALVFAAPDIKATPTATLPLNARLAAGDHDERFIALHGGGFVHRRHVARLELWSDDPVDVARGLLGTPYLWGGRTRDGVDCSGLVQAALFACGLACPRDSDQQRDAFQAIDWRERRRGDLVFVPGHVGILVDADRLLHANAFAMTTWIEPLAAVLDRLEPGIAPALRRVDLLARPSPCSPESQPL